MKRVLFPLLSGLLCLSFFSCGGDSSSPLSEEGLPEHPSINVVFSPNGPGDNGYLDKMLNAATVYSIAHPGAMRMIMPYDSLEAKGIFQNLDDIAKDEAVKDTVLSIFVGSEYQKVLYQADAPKGKHKVLLIEDNGAGAPEWLHTCEINRFGASYLAGAMVAQQSAIVIAAMAGDPAVDRAVEGFRKGFGSVKGREVDSVFYLSDSYDGFKMQEKARKLTDSISAADYQYRTIFPVAGAANMGVYNALTDWGHIQAIGMDKDFSYMAHPIPFSIVLNVDSLLLDCLNIWDASQTLPKRRTEGLGSKYIGWVYNEDWNKHNSLFDWDVESPTYDEGYENKVLTIEFWKQRYEMYVDQAIKEEKAYETR